MVFTTVQPVWQALRGRFQKTVSVLPEQDLDLKIGNSSIGSMIYHNAEVEYMFAEWFFGKPMPDGLKDNQASSMNLEQLVQFLTNANAHLIDAMRELPDEAWTQPVESAMGVSTPLEAIGRLMYHTGIHSGQISLIQKNARHLTDDRMKE